MERPATSTVSVKIRNHVISTGIVFDIIGVVFWELFGFIRTFGEGGACPWECVRHDRGHALMKDAQPEQIEAGATIHLAPLQSAMRQSMGPALLWSHP
jgi:hypothetical protein